ncbi:hypothetical protein ACFX2G_034851 [Malus domestica]
MGCSVAHRGPSYSFEEFLVLFICIIHMEPRKHRPHDLLLVPSQICNHNKMDSLGSSLMAEMRSDRRSNHRSGSGGLWDAEATMDSNCATSTLN